MEQCLTKTQNEIDAVLGFYDGITAGAIAAMEPQDLAGVVPVYGGQNPELSGLQYMLNGYQVDNIMKPFSVEADAAVQLVIAAITGSEPPAGLVNEVFDNGFGEIPTASLAVQHFLVDAIQQVVDEGIFTWEEICTGPAEGTDVCNEQVGG
jgi:D-xylose transport system substrate-binding protein